MDLFTRLREAHEATGLGDKIIMLIVVLVALGVLVVMIRAILGSVINYDDRDC